MEKKPFDLDDPKVRSKLEEIFKRIQEDISSLTDPIRESSKLTAADYNIRINSPPLELPADYDFS